MNDLLLIPSFEQKAEIDPELARLQLAVEHAEEKNRAAAEDALHIYQNKPPEGKPQLSIRFIPIPIFSHAMSMLARAGENIDLMYDAYREICRWGVTAWNLKGAFGRETITLRGVGWMVAGWDVIDVLEFRGWLIPAARAIIRINELSDEQKKK